MIVTVFGASLVAFIADDMDESQSQLHQQTTDYQAPPVIAAAPVVNKPAEDNAQAGEADSVPNQDTADVNNATEQPQSQPEQPQAEVEGKKKRKVEQTPQWFEIDDNHNTQVYVSNLPLDITEEELITLMKKCGFLMKDPDTGQLKVKMYKDKEGHFKGDALVAYLKRESVDLAIQLLDESYVKNNLIRVEQARFQLKGEYDPSKKPKRSKKSKEKMKKSAER